MNSKTILLAVLILLGGCTFKGEINDKTNERNEETEKLPKESNDQNENESQSELPRFGSVEFYSFQKNTGREFKRSISILEQDSGGLFLSDPIFLPPGDVSLSINFKSQRLVSHRADLAKIENGGEGATVLVPLDGSGENDVDYQLNTKNLSKTGVNDLSVQISNQSVDEEPFYITGIAYETPTDISISVASPENSGVRDESKDKYTEAGTFYYLHDLIIHNNHPYQVEIEVPLVMASNYLVRTYRDVEVIYQAARNIDLRNCGAAVSISRDFREESLSTLGIYLFPSASLDETSIKKYLGQNSSIIKLNRNESVQLSLFTEGRSDLEVANKIFGQSASSVKRIVSGCTSKKEWVDPIGDGRDWQNRFGETNPFQPLGHYVYYGEPQYSDVTLHRGISRTFLDFNNPQNRQFKVRPVGSYKDTILNNSPSSLFDRHLLYSNGVE